MANTTVYYTAPLVTQLSWMPVGAGDTFRIGDTVSPKELELRFSLYPHVGTTAVVNYRVLVVE